MILETMLAAFLLQSPHDYPTDGIIEAAITITGASSAEDLDDDIAEKFREYAAHPVRINIESRSRLLSCGLFNLYQVASLLDYRERYGPIRSTVELSAVEGFPSEYASALSHFISYDERSYATGSDRIQASTRERLCLKDNGSLSYGLRLEASLTDAAGATFIRSCPYDGPARTGFSFMGTSRDRRTIIYAGDFHVRYGQGLGIWSGFSLTGLSSIQSFCRNAGGISRATSYSGSGCMRGAGIQYGGRHVKASAFVSPVADWKAGGNLSILGKYWEAGLNCIAEDGGFISTIDGRLCLDGLDLGCELACDPGDRCMAGVAYARKRLVEGVETAFALRAYPENYGATAAGAIRSSTSCKNERGLSAGLNWRATRSTEATLTVDMIQKYVQKGNMQFKMLLLAKWAAENGRWGASLRAVARMRNYEEGNRRGIRLESVYDDGSWRLAPRAEWVCFKDDACLFSMEEGFRRGVFSIYSRQTAFHVDNWDDRIYVYERDLPGSFSVPACNGRGFRITACAALKFPHNIRMDAKVGKVLRWDDREKDMLEMKVQLNASLSGRKRPSSESL